MSAAKVSIEADGKSLAQLQSFLSVQLEGLRSKGQNKCANALENFALAQAELIQDLQRAILTKKAEVEETDTVNNTTSTKESEITKLESSVQQLKSQLTHKVQGAQLQKFAIAAFTTNELRKVSPAVFKIANARYASVTAGITAAVRLKRQIAKLRNEFSGWQADSLSQFKSQLLRAEELKQLNHSLVKDYATTHEQSKGLAIVAGRREEVQRSALQTEKRAAAAAISVTGLGVSSGWQRAAKDAAIRVAAVAAAQQQGPCDNVLELIALKHVKSMGWESAKETPPGPVIITKVEHLSWAWQSGLLPDDELLQIGNRFVATMTKEEFETALKKRPQHLVFALRSGKPRHEGQRPPAPQGLQRPAAKPRPFAQGWERAPGRAPASKYAYASKTTNT